MTDKEKENRVMRLVNAAKDRNEETLSTEGERKHKMYPVWTPKGVEKMRKIIAANRD